MPNVQGGSLRRWFGEVEVCRGHALILGRGRVKSRVGSVSHTSRTAVVDAPHRLRLNEGVHWVAGGWDVPKAGSIEVGASSSDILIVGLRIQECFPSH